MAISVVSFSFSRAAQPEAWGPTLLGAGFLYRILSPTGLVSKTNWLPVFTKLYNSSIAHSISLEWHVWSSSSGNNCHAIHRSLSSGALVYDCNMGFYLVPYCQPCPPTRFLPITATGMRLWNGMFGRVEGQYTTLFSVPGPINIPTPHIVALTEVSHADAETNVHPLKVSWYFISLVCRYLCSWMHIMTMLWSITETVSCLFYLKFESWISFFVWCLNIFVIFVLVWVL